MIKSTLLLLKTRNSFFFFLLREMITAFSQCIRKFFNLWQVKYFILNVSEFLTRCLTLFRKKPHHSFSFPENNYNKINETNKLKSI